MFNSIRKLSLTTRVQSLDKEIIRVFYLLSKVYEQLYWESQYHPCPVFKVLVKLLVYFMFELILSKIVTSLTQKQN